MRLGVHITRDEQLTSLERSVFSQIRSVLPPVEVKEKPPVMNIKEVNLEEAIRELLEIERASITSLQEHQQ